MRKLGTLSSLHTLTQFDDISVLDEERDGDFVSIFFFTILVCKKGQIEIQGHMGCFIFCIYSN
jgi:hypothetical protein